MTKLINAESLKGAVSSTMDMQTKYLPTQFVELIDNCPSEKAVVRGKWKKNKSNIAGDGYFICSNCKSDFYDKTPFCPQCGCRME